MSPRTTGRLALVGALGLALAAPAVAGAAPGSTGGAVQGVVQAPGGRLDVRQSPGGGAVVARVKHGRKLAIRCQANGPAADGPYGRSKVWDRVKLKAGVGYVPDSSVYTGSDGLVADPCDTPQRNGRTAPGRVATQSLPLVVRRGPNTGGREVGRLASGTRVRISCQTTGDAVAGTLGTSTIWNRITSPVTGFIPDSYTYTGSDGRVARKCQRGGGDGPKPPSDDQGSGGGPRPGGAEEGRCTKDVPFRLEPSPSSRDQFIGWFGDDARRSDRATKVPGSVTLGQGILESGDGQHTAGANNFFGIKATPKGGGIHRWGDEAVGCVFRKTSEVENGQTVSVMAPFRLYRSAKDSFVDHAEFLVENPRYAAAFRVPNDSREFLRRVARAGYATDPNYASLVIGLMDQNRLYRFDVR
jgi:flagellar protein FlgJ